MKVEVIFKQTKQITINDLKNTDHIGFIISNGEKGYITYSNFKFIASSTSEIGWCTSSNGFFGVPSGDIKNVIESIDYCIQKLISVYKFDTRKELYQWLAE